MLTKILNRFLYICGRILHCSFEIRMLENCPLVSEVGSSTMAPNGPSSQYSCLWVWVGPSGLLLISGITNGDRMSLPGQATTGHLLACYLLSSSLSLAHSESSCHVMNCPRGGPHGKKPKEMVGQQPEKNWDPSPRAWGNWILSRIMWMNLEADLPHLNLEMTAAPGDDLIGVW